DYNESYNNLIKNPKHENDTNHEMEEDSSFKEDTKTESKDEINGLSSYKNTETVTSTVKKLRQSTNSCPNLDTPTFLKTTPTNKKVPATDNNQKKKDNRKSGKTKTNTGGKRSESSDSETVISQASSS